LNSIDGDGTKAGYDVEATRTISDIVSVPVVASGGAGNLDHMVEVVQKVMPALFWQRAFSITEPIPWRKSKSIFQPEGFHAQLLSFFNSNMNLLSSGRVCRSYY
jgi:hypothetical protein